MSKIILENQNDLLLKKLLIFYKEDNLKRMLSIINGETNISLRIIDWFTTNYAKKKNTRYETKTNKRFFVYEDYKLKLKAFKKQRFDPFCRWSRIRIPYGTNCSIETTIGQLNFFKWALENDLLKYIKENYSLIENDMNTNNSFSRSKKQYLKNTRKKREELSESGNKCINREEIMVSIKFK